jgi:hypothetical protein
MDDNISVTIPEIDLSPLGYTIDMSTANANFNYGNITISSTASSGAFLTSNGLNGSSWSTVGSSYSQPSLKVTGDADFEGDIKVKGHSLVKLLKTIEDRLAIIQDPSPEKLEKFAALKKAYEHYKTLERLIGEE